MKPAVLFVSLILAAAARAQGPFTTSGTTVTLALAWSELRGNHNGVLEPGESALLRMTASFTNQNTVVTFTPGLGTFGSGTLRGFGSMFLDINGSGGAQGDWDVSPAHGYGVDPIWDLAGYEGTPTNGGSSLVNLEAAQFPLTPAEIITANPVIDLWRGVWTPAQYSARPVAFRLSPNAAPEGATATVLVQLSGALAMHVQPEAAHLMLGFVSIPIIPAPASAFIIAVALAARRRRR
jgi:hypothetical protein